MSVALITHPNASGHETPPGHPEQIARHRAVLDALADLPLTRLEAPQASESELLRAHPQSYIDRIRNAIPARGLAMLDADTHASPGSWEAAIRGVGGALLGVDRVLSGQDDAAFVAMRPPGHHAERDTAMGFCLFANTAIAARYALDHHGLARVAVLDFDVHHGNGTQDVLWDEPRALFASTHQMPLYPGSGAASETGAHGQIINHPLAPGSGGAEARAAWDEILTQVTDFAPELIIISAGFDAHADDPLAQLMWQDEDFAAITRAVCKTAQSCGAKLVSCLEGGYDLAALGRAARAHVTELIHATEAER